MSLVATIVNTVFSHFSLVLALYSSGSMMAWNRSEDGPSIRYQITDGGNIAGKGQC